VGVERHTNHGGNTFAITRDSARMEDEHKTDGNMSRGEVGWRKERGVLSYNNVQYGIDDCPAEKGEMKEDERVEILTFQLRCEELSVAP